VGTGTIKVNLEVPEGIPDQIKAAVQARVQEAAVLAFWEEDALSTRRAAEELGLTYREFLDLLAAKGIPIENGPLNLKAIEAAEHRLVDQRP
jgi:predicted HTH domain antitoxin